MAREQAKRSGADHNVMRELNRSLVLDLVKQQSPISRAAIAKETALAKPTVSAIVDDLLAAGLVREIGVGETTTGGGRPPILLEFNARSQFLAGVHLGVSTTTVVIADARGEELVRGSHRTPKGGPDVVLDDIASAVEQLLAEVGTDRSRLAAVGVVVPGLVDQQGVCLLAPNLGWRDVDVATPLRERLGPAVYVHNAAQASVVAEHLEGAAKGATDVVLIYAGSGIGAGVLAGGRLFHGAAGIAGEAGHCKVPNVALRCGCGGIGCIETLASAQAVVRAVRDLVKEGRTTSLKVGPSLTAEAVAAAAAEGDEVAGLVMAFTGEALGVLASWLVNLFNPQVVVVGGGLAQAGETLLGPLRATLARDALPQSYGDVDVRQSELGQGAEARGAVLLALQSSETYYRVIFQS